MRIFAIDDEPRLLDLLHKAIAQAAPEAELMDFSLGADAVEAIEARGLLPDAVFSDIRMPGMDGLALAVRIKQLAPDAQIVFVTGYADHAADAYRIHARGYILKPVDAARVREELEQFPPPAPPERGKLQARCFGYFEAYWDGKPLTFHRRQTKELLAYLIDREGATCTAEEAIAALWEEDGDLKTGKHRIRNLIGDLRSTLEEIGMGEALIRGRDWLAIRRDMIDCDYYRMLDGDTAAVNSFRGEYMAQYSWAELTRGMLYFRNIK